MPARWLTDASVSGGARLGGDALPASAFSGHPDSPRNTIGQSINCKLNALDSCARRRAAQARTAGSPLGRPVSAINHDGLVLTAPPGHWRDEPPFSSFPWRRQQTKTVDCSFFTAHRDLGREAPSVPGLRQKAPTAAIVTVGCRAMVSWPT